MNKRVIGAVAISAGMLVIGNYCMVKEVQAKTRQEMIDNAARHDEELDRETEESEGEAVNPAAEKREPQEQVKAEPSKPAVSQKHTEKTGDVPVENKPEQTTSQAAAPPLEPRSTAPEKKDWWNDGSMYPLAAISMVVLIAGFLFYRRRIRNN